MFHSCCIPGRRARGIRSVLSVDFVRKASREKGSCDSFFVVTFRGYRGALFEADSPSHAARDSPLGEVA